MSTCTWEGCTTLASRPQHGKDGSQWANLCEAHNVQMVAAVINPNVKVMLSSWVRAQGGPKKTAERM